MDKWESLNHPKWECKYHVLFIIAQRVMPAAWAERHDQANRPSSRLRVQRIAEGDPHRGVEQHAGQPPGRKSRDPRVHVCPPSRRNIDARRSFS